MVFFKYSCISSKSLNQHSPFLIKYNLFDLTSIKVYTPKGEYLCTAERVTETHPMAKLLGDVKDYEDYKQKLVRQRKLKKKTIESVKKYLETFIGIFISINFYYIIILKSLKSTFFNIILIPSTFTCLSIFSIY